ncbi:hypothetical protein ULG90_15085 [Halopseudomonas pachastrellae]|nr:hypothetical protein ULG90_15085 [Halopseudomonas pachastrellae]
MLLASLQRVAGLLEAGQQCVPNSSKANPPPDFPKACRLTLLE